MAKKAKKTARRASKRNVRRASPQRRRRRVVREAARPLRTVRSRTASRVQRKPAASARSAKRPVVQRLSPRPSPVPQQPQGLLVGEIQHYYTHLGVGVLEVHDLAVQVGDKIRIKGVTTDFVQVVRSMQLDHAPVERVEKGQSVGLKVDQHVREHDKVYRL